MACINLYLFVTNFNQTVFLARELLFIYFMHGSSSMTKKQIILSKKENDTEINQNVSGFYHFKFILCNPTVLPLKCPAY